MTIGGSTGRGTFPPLLRQSSECFALLRNSPGGNVPRPFVPASRVQPAPGNPGPGNLYNRRLWLKLSPSCRAS
jgi:hypothetical protein